MSTVTLIRPLARSWAATEDRLPLNDPMGVLLAATITTSATIAQLAALHSLTRLTLGLLKTNRFLFLTGEEKTPSQVRLDHNYRLLTVQSEMYKILTYFTIGFAFSCVCNIIFMICIHENV